MIGSGHRYLKQNKYVNNKKCFRDVAIHAQTAQKLIITETIRCNDCRFGSCRGVSN